MLLLTTAQARRKQTELPRKCHYLQIWWVGGVPSQHQKRLKRCSSEPVSCVKIYGAARNYTALGDLRSAGCDDAELPFSACVSPIGRRIRRECSGWWTGLIDTPSKNVQRVLSKRGLKIEVSFNPRILENSVYRARCSKKLVLLFICSFPREKAASVQIPYSCPIPQVVLQ